MAYSIAIDTNRHILTLFKDGIVYRIYPAATGKPSTPTPKGTFKIINRVVNPGGPFGVRWLGLNKRRYGIHGTNDPASIGKNITNGSVRLHNKDILELSNRILIGTEVKIF
jgi:lipoprotein-anchoring transpeptidase ErfK/SrfK